MPYATFQAAQPANLDVGVELNITTDHGIFNFSIASSNFSDQGIVIQFNQSLEVQLSMSVL